MLQILGAIFYLVAAVLLWLALRLLLDGAEGSALTLGLLGVVTTAFFGAMCFAVDEIRGLLTRLAAALAPETVPDVPAATASVGAQLAGTFGNASAHEVMEKHGIVSDGNYYVCSDGRRYRTFVEAVDHASRPGGSTG